MDINVNHITTGAFHNDPKEIMAEPSDPQSVEDHKDIPQPLENEQASDSMEHDDNEDIALENEAQQEQKLACKRIAVEIIGLVGEEGVSWKAVEKMAAIYKDVHIQIIGSLNLEECWKNVNPDKCN